MREIILSILLILLTVYPLFLFLGDFTNGFENVKLVYLLPCFIGTPLCLFGLWRLNK